MRIRPDKLGDDSFNGDANGFVVGGIPVVRQRIQRREQKCEQQTVPFPAGSVWVCFSDQTSHAVMSGQYMLEQTLHLPAARQYNADSSPLAILSRLTGRTLV